VLFRSEDLTDRLLARLRDGALDAAVIATDPREARLASIELYDEPFFLVSADRNGKHGRGSIGVEEIDPGVLLLLTEGHCLREQALALCGAAERTALGADVRGTSLETLRHLASAGQGATLAPLLAYADWRRSGAGIEGSKIVGEGASRLVRLVFRRGSPRRCAQPPPPPSPGPYAKRGSPCSLRNGLLRPRALRPDSGLRAEICY